MIKPFKSIIYYKIKTDQFKTPVLILRLRKDRLLRVYRSQEVNIDQLVLVDQHAKK